jgi:hypothetical protein
MCMLKKIYIVSLVLLIGVGNILIMQGAPKSDQFSNRGILGVIDINKVTNEVKQVKPATVDNISSKSKLELPLSQPTQEVETEIRLEGNGCGENKAPNICKVVNNQKPGEILKQCDENSWEKCNFYIYQLGKRDGETQYILQNYTENSDRLLDVLAYNIKTNLVSQIKTVLYQENLPITAPANADYTTTLDQFKAI